MCGVSGDASLSPPALGVGHWAGRWITLDYLAGEMNEEKEKKKKRKEKKKGCSVKSRRSWRTC
jgi:hypothetical protein